MITIRKSEERGRTDLGWLQGRFSFSFADYFDPRHMGFRVLRVLNDDHIAPGKGFGPHAHRDMEIITYVIEGALRHRDSTGENHVLRPNEVQTMSAGTGIVHSEFNASEEEPVHSLQIWIIPAIENVKPAYQQIAFDPMAKRGRLQYLAGPHSDNPAPATVIHQDARLYVCELGTGETITQTITPERHAWIQMARGSVAVNGYLLGPGDGAAVSNESELIFSSDSSGEFLFFDLP